MSKLCKWTQSHKGTRTLVGSSKINSGLKGANISKNVQWLGGCKIWRVWPKQVCSLEFWCSDYNSSTSFFYDTIYSKMSEQFKKKKYPWHHILEKFLCVPNPDMYLKLTSVVGSKGPVCPPILLASVAVPHGHMHFSKCFFASKGAN